MICSDRWQSKLADSLDYGQARTNGPSSYRGTRKGARIENVSARFESKDKAAELMKQAKKSEDRLNALNRASQTNGKGLDKAVLDSALDDLIETFREVNKKLDDLLAKAKQ
jgi:hypothetical protein